ncbi:hypothetical protein [Pseudomonas aeruginosa]|nr:hypothetical protein [Pseudomonas aeruginosa]
MNLIPYDFNSKQVQVLVDESGERRVEVRIAARRMEIGYAA